MRKLLILLTILTLVSCKTTETVYVPVENTKIEYVNIKDSIYVHDSIYLEIVTRNETIYNTKYQYKYIDRYHVDTLIRVDSIPIIKEVEKVVTVNELNFFLKLLCMVGGICGTILLCIIAFKLIKLLR